MPASVAGVQLSESFSKEAPLGVGLREVEGPLVGVAGVAVAARAARQVGVGRVEIAVMLELERVENCGPGGI
jgi:hypothetical protein